MQHILKSTLVAGKCVINDTTTDTDYLIKYIKRLILNVVSNVYLLQITILSLLLLVL